MMSVQKAPGAEVLREWWRRQILSFLKLRSARECGQQLARSRTFQRKSMTETHARQGRCSTCSDRARSKSQKFEVLCIVWRCRGISKAIALRCVTEWFGYRARFESDKATLTLDINPAIASSQA